METVGTCPDNRERFSRVGLLVSSRTVGLCCSLGVEGLSRGLLVFIVYLHPLKAYMSWDLDDETPK